MTSPLIQVQFDQLKQIEQIFMEQAQRVSRERALLMRNMQMLQRGGWISDAASRFYREMDQTALPGVERLQRAMVQGAMTTRNIAAVFDGADEEAGGTLRSTIGGAGGRAGGVMGGVGAALGAAALSKTAASRLAKSHGGSFGRAMGIAAGTGMRKVGTAVSNMTNRILSGKPPVPVGLKHLPGNKLLGSIVSRTPVIGPAVGGIRNVVDKIGGNFINNAAAGINNVMGRVGDVASTVVNQGITNIGRATGMLVNGTTGIAERYTGLLQQGVHQLPYGISGPLRPAVDMLHSGVSTAGGLARAGVQFGNDMVSVFTGGGNVLDRAARFGTGVIDFAGSTGRTVVEAVAAPVKAVADVGKDLFEGAGDVVKKLKFW